MNRTHAAEPHLQRLPALPTVARAEQTPLTGLQIARRAALPVACAALILTLLAVASPTINGRPVAPGALVSRAAPAVAPAAYYPGDLLDIRGRVLAPGRGNPPSIVVNGRPVGSDYRVRFFDHVTVMPGTDKPEPSREVAHVYASADRLRVVRYIEGVISHERTELEDVTTVVQRNGPRVALTFDDGPHPRWTPRILDLLKRYDVHATFFVLGPMCKYYTSLLRREIAEGHEIGCHSWAHPQYARLSPAARAADLSRWEAVVVPILGHKPVWFRPPYGSVNSAVRAQLRARGYRVVLWTVDTQDWRKPPAEVIARRIVSGARKDGAIILMHDGGGDRSRTVAALAIALPKLIESGVQLLTLSQLKGLAPAPPPELVLIGPAGPQRVRPVKTQVYVGDQAITPPPSAAVCAGHLLLAARAVCQALGARVNWDGQLKALTIDGPRGRAVLRLGSTRVTVNGRDARISIPIIRAGGVVLAPVHLLARVTGTVAVVSADLGRVDFVPSAAAVPATASPDAQ